MMLFRGGSRAAATSKMEHFVIIVNGFQPLTIIIKRSILHVAAAQDPPLHPEAIRSCDSYEFFTSDFIDNCEDIHSLINQLTIDHYSISNIK